MSARFELSGKARRTIPMLFVLVCLPALAQEAKSPILTPQEKRLAAKALTLNNQGARLHQQGKSTEAVGKLNQSLEIYRRIYPPSKYPAGHRDLALGLLNVGAVLQAAGSEYKAMPFMEQALAMNQRLYPKSRFSDGHIEIARSHNNLGTLYWSLGWYDKALPHCEQGLAMTQKLYPVSQYPDGHGMLAGSYVGLGVVLQAMGLFDKALPHIEQAITIYRKLYPEAKHRNGHVDLARALNNLGYLYQGMGLHNKALPYYEQAFEMREKLFSPAKFPDGHPELVVTINNLASQLRKMGSPRQALSRAEQAVAMMKKLYPVSKYPDGQPTLAVGLNTLGVLYLETGSDQKALSHIEEALAMTKRLYPPSRFPDGHFEIANGLRSLGGYHYAKGSFDKALPNIDQAAAMTQKLSHKVIATASEAQALALTKIQPFIQDSFLSLTRHISGSDAAAYRMVWVGKSAITRVLGQRHATARMAGTEHADKLDELKRLRRHIDHLLQDRQLPTAERDKLLSAATDDRDTLERELAKKLPLLQRGKELEELGPGALLELLPDDAVLIDLVHYGYLDYDRTQPGLSGETRTPCYAAFVLAKGQPIRRVELPEAKKIDKAIAEWRSALESCAGSSATTQLHDLVWKKLSPSLPAGTKTLYLALDGDLARLPWAALPIGENRVLLEDYAVATVPHGPFLLENLKYPQPSSANDSVLALGNVAYNSKTWPELPGTSTELKSIAFRSPIALSGKEASSARVLAELPKARYAHLATHGFFDVETLTAEKKREAQARKNHQFGDNTQRVAGKNPLAFTGLVLTDGEVLSGLKLVDLPLENLKLVTLSACETGLGEYTAGEGVQGLQRAFHLAGCPNVVASLWKVNDVATAALMAKFYHELWIRKRPPIEALREAQLLIYRRPDLIADLSGERGRPSLEKASKLTSIDPIPKQANGIKTADTKLWAGFVLSGIGK